MGEGAVEQASAQRVRITSGQHAGRKGLVTSISRANGWRQVKLDHGPTVAVRKMHPEELPAGGPLPPMRRWLRRRRRVEWRRVVMRREGRREAAREEGAMEEGARACASRAAHMLDATASAGSISRTPLGRDTGWRQVMLDDGSTVSARKKQQLKELSPAPAATAVVEVAQEEDRGGGDFEDEVAAVRKRDEEEEEEAEGGGGSGGGGGVGAARSF